MAITGVVFNCLENKTLISNNNISRIFVETFESSKKAIAF